MAATNPSRANRSLDHIPGDDGLPVIGNTLYALSDPLRLVRRNFDRYGPVFRGNTFRMRSVTVVGPDAAQQVLQDRDNNFSSKLGWHNNLGALFSGGLMLRDFDEHRFHRRLVLPAFKPKALESYLLCVNRTVHERMAALRGRGEVPFYRFAKEAMLHLGVAVFFGLDLDAREAVDVNRAISSMTAAATAIIRTPIPGSTFRRGQTGRAHLEAFIRRAMARKEAEPGDDMLSQLCRAMKEPGDRLTERDVIDHMIFIVMASHDTVASAATALAYLLARDRKWQERIRGESAEVGTDAISHAELDRLRSLDSAFKEALRLYPPVPAIPRRTIRECRIEGHRIPENTAIWVLPMLNHRLAAWWADPERFDPSRFSVARAEDRRHAFLWLPFGAGAHTCIGLHLGGLMVKTFMHHLLLHYSLQIPEDRPVFYRMFPFPHPSGDLPVRLRKAPA